MIPVGCLLVLQAVTSPFTVGDTVTILRTVTLPVGAVLRFPPAPPDRDHAYLSVPSVEPDPDGRSVRIRYTLTFWRAGSHPIEIPGPVVVRATGSADTLPSYRITVPIQSVLPSTADDSTAPQPPVEVIPRATRVLWPALLLPLLALAVIIPVHRVRRRPPPDLAPPAPAPAIPDPGITLPPWVALGEVRTTAAHWLAVLPAEEPEMEDLARLRARLTRAQFSTPDDPDAREVCADAATWWRRARGDAGGERSA